MSDEENVVYKLTWKVPSLFGDSKIERVEHYRMWVQAQKKASALRAAWDELNFGLSSQELDIEISKIELKG